VTNTFTITHTHVSKRRREPTPPRLPSDISKTPADSGDISMAVVDQCGSDPIRSIEASRTSRTILVYTTTEQLPTNASVYHDSHCIGHQ
jgi:hypothetical protein